MRYRKSFFFFNDTATTEIYTLSLHDALPISPFTPAKDDGSLNVEHLFTEKGNDQEPQALPPLDFELPPELEASEPPEARGLRSEEHTSELQSRQYLVCRLLLEKKNNKQPHST